MLMNEHKEHNSFVAVQLLSRVWLCNPTDCSTPGFPVSHHLSELAQTYICWVGNAMHHLIFWCPLPLLLSIFSTVGVFSNESALCIRWPKYWCLTINPSNEYSGLISFRMDWFDLLEVQGTLKSLLQKHQLNCGVCVLIVSFEFTDFSRFLTPIGELGEWLIP